MTRLLTTTIPQTQVHEHASCVHKCVVFFFKTAVVGPYINCHRCDSELSHSSMSNNIYWVSHFCTPLVHSTSHELLLRFVSCSEVSITFTHTHTHTHIYIYIKTKVYSYAPHKLKLKYTAMRDIMTFWSTTERIYEGGPIRL